MLVYRVIPNNGTGRVQALYHNMLMPTEHKQTVEKVEEVSILEIPDAPQPT